MAELLLIRHGKTAGNLLGRYIGSRTDEPLCEEGREGLGGKQLPEVERLYASPMKRCVETAELLWPGFDQKKIEIVTDLRECDFGDFENKNYKELSGNEDYQAWIDSNGTRHFPMASLWMYSKAGAGMHLHRLWKKCLWQSGSGKRPGRPEPSGQELWCMVAPLWQFWNSTGIQSAPILTIR